MSVSRSMIASLIVAAHLGGTAPVAVQASTHSRAARAAACPHGINDNAVGSFDTLNTNLDICTIWSQSPPGGDLMEVQFVDRNVSSCRDSTIGGQTSWDTNADGIYKLTNVERRNGSFVAVIEPANPSIVTRIEVYRLRWPGQSKEQRERLIDVIPAVVAHERGHAYIASWIVHSLSGDHLLTSTDRGDAEIEAKNLARTLGDKALTIVARASVEYDALTQGGSTQSEVGGVNSTAIELCDYDLVPESLPWIDVGESRDIRINIVGSTGSSIPDEAVVGYQITYGSLPPDTELSVDGQMRIDAKKAGQWRFTVTAVADVGGAVIEASRTYLLVFQDKIKVVSSHQYARAFSGTAPLDGTRYYSCSESIARSIELTTETGRGDYSFIAMLNGPARIGDQCNSRLNGQKVTETLPVLSAGQMKSLSRSAQSQADLHSVYYSSASASAVRTVIFPAHTSGSSQDVTVMTAASASCSIEKRLKDPEKKGLNRRVGCSSSGSASTVFVISEEASITFSETTDSSETIDTGSGVKTTSMAVVTACASTFACAGRSTVLATDLPTILPSGLYTLQTLLGVSVSDYSVVTPASGIRDFDIAVLHTFHIAAA